MRGYQAKSDRQIAGGAEQRSEDRTARSNASASGTSTPLAGSPKAASLLQLRHALDRSPKVQSQVALQRALDQRAAVKTPAKKKLAGKPALQKKGIAINDDAGLEREADVMGARAAVVTPLQRAASGAVIQRVLNVNIEGVATDIEGYDVSKLVELRDSGKLWDGKDFPVIKERIATLEKWTQKDKKEAKSTEGAKDTNEDTTAAGKERAKWVEPLLAMKGHLAGEIKGDELKGGHLLKLMQDTHKKKLKTIDKPVEGVWDCNWTLQKEGGGKNAQYPVKQSTMFPASWTWDKLKTELNKSYRISGHIFLEGGIGLNTPGDTFYPDKSSAPAADAKKK